MGNKYRKETIWKFSYKTYFIFFIIKLIIIENNSMFLWPLAWGFINPLTPGFFFRQFLDKAFKRGSYRLQTHRLGTHSHTKFFDELFLKGNWNFGQRGPYGPPGRWRVKQSSIVIYDCYLKAFQAVGLQVCSTNAAIKLKIIRSKVKKYEIKKCNAIKSKKCMQ